MNGDSQQEALRKHRRAEVNEAAGVSAPKAEKGCPQQAQADEAGVQVDQPAMLLNADKSNSDLDTAEENNLLTRESLEAPRAPWEQSGKRDGSFFLYNFDI